MVARVLRSGATYKAPSIASSAFASSKVSDAISPELRILPPPGRIEIRFVPMDSIRLSTSCFPPSPIAIMVTTAATPMMMPSKVSNVRNQFSRSDENAMPSAAPVEILGKTLTFGGCCCPVSTDCIFAAPVSSTISPSSSFTWRWACSATAGSWVIRIIVTPSWCSDLSRASNCSPLAESSAPVGSSARITSAPLISARATDTRCCCPPDNSPGRWVMRSSSPSLPSNCAA